MTGDRHTFSERLAWGLTLMAASLLISLLQSGYSLTQMGNLVDQQTVRAAQANPLYMVLSCLSPFAWLLQAVSAGLVFADSRRLGGAHRSLALGALLLVALSVGITITTFFVSLSAVQQGSLAMMKAMIWLAMAGSLCISFSAAMMIFKVSPGWARGLLLLGAALALAGYLGTSWMSAAVMALQRADIMGTAMWMPQPNLDRTAGLYPILAALPVAGSLLYLVAYSALAVISWKAVSSEIPETVS